MRSRTKKIIFVTVLVIGAVFLGFNYFLNSNSIPRVSAAPTDCNVIGAGSKFLKGWAWSSNIGWVNFNCEDQGVCATSDYKVGLGASGDLTGCAWSSNIGWIRFNPQTSSAPETPNQSAHIDNGTGLVSGWARACNVFQTECSGSLKNNAELGGWDGWIKMSGSWTDNVGTPQYEGGVRLSGNKLEGFAWGGDVVGWLNFDPQNWPGNYGPGVTIENMINCSNFSASPSSVKPLQTTTLSWQCQLANNCRIDANVSGQTLGQVCNSESECNSGSATTNQINRKTTFTLTCTDQNGFQTSPPNVTVDINFTPTRCEINPRTGAMECP